MSDRLPLTSKPRGLVTRALRAFNRPDAPDDGTTQGTRPHVVDPVAWCDEHFVLLQQLLHLVKKAIADRTGRDDEALPESIGLAHAALRRHAALAVSDALPTVLSRDGGYAIPYERLAEARAKVQVLTAENAELRAKLAAVGREQHAAQPSDDLRRRAREGDSS